MFTYYDGNKLFGPKGSATLACGENVSNITEACQITNDDQCRDYCANIGLVSGNIGQQLRSLLLEGLDETSAFDWFLSDCNLRGANRRMKCWKRVIAEDGICYVTDLSKFNRRYPL